VANICLWALVAETDEEAQRLFTSRARWRVARDRGIFGPLTAPEEDPPFPFTPADEARVSDLRKTAFVGSAATVGARLRELAAQLGIEEIVVLTWSHDPVARRRSYELLAAEFGLSSS
jgi:alkanesulfonate monooxygenase SsuD/methylene tetrahydromethanopterin reductase-like flavin-dependent oxidoreductase (luciferase family)